MIKIKNITIAGKVQELDENAFYGVKCWIETYKIVMCIN